MQDFRPGPCSPAGAAPAALDGDDAPPEDVAVDVLVVDDDEKNLRALRALLGTVPARLVEARSGEEALKWLLRRDFALVLLDVQMPGMDGLETAALIRERERSRRTPIIFLTAFGQNDAQLLQAYRLGAVDFLTKPIRPQEVLRDKVAWFVELHRTGRLLEEERSRARAAELREHERAVAEARRRGEAEALRADVQRQRDLLDRVNRSNERLRLLASAGTELLLAAQPRDALAPLLASISAKLGLELHLVHLRDPAGRLALAWHGGLGDAPPELVRSPPPGSIFDRALAELRSVVAEEVGAAPERHPALGALGVTSAASFPLVAGERVLGTLTLATRRRPRLDPDDTAVLALVADEAAMALERARLLDELQRRAAELAAADRRKDDFLAQLAHELRNPLAPILNAVEILRDEATPRDACRRAVDVAGRQVRHVARLVGDLVDVSRVRAGKFELRRARVELARAVADAVAAVEPHVRERRQALEVELPEDPVALDADHVRVVQVLENLLHNASKYGRLGGRVRLAAARDGGEVAVRVADDGIGIAPELLPRVFDMFVQGEQPPDRPRAGLGLGLTLVRTLVEMHGGRVEARSDGPGRGSTFEVRLPALPEEESAPAPTPVPCEPAVRPLRIALIEDNEDIRSTLRELLERRGHDVVEAGDGAEGVALVAAQQPDVALVDIGLPALDGYAVAERIRAAPNGRTRLVALTGYGGADDRGRTSRAGFDAHLVKPVEIQELSRVLARFC
jgi:signal transduction histidine kinase/DNA-binding response OmpR family regulator